MANNDSFRLLEIEVDSARLTAEKRGNFYVRISIGEDQSLRTKLANCSKDEDRYTPRWKQRFVFSVPRDFISGGDSAVTFAVFKARKYVLPDSALGHAACGVKALFPVDECMGDTDQGKPMYDTEDDHREYLEPEIQEKETFRLKASAGIPIMKGESEIGMLNVSLSAWEKYFPYELNLNGRMKKTYPIIFKGSEKVGRLSMQKPSPCSSVVLSFQEKHFPILDYNNAKWRNLAMEFDEFLILQQQQLQQRDHADDDEKKLPRRANALCFA